MARWSSELMSSELAARVNPAPESPDWLGFDSASEQDLEELENRLGLILPPSYRSFLLMSNGWRRTTFAIDRIRPVGEVYWFRVENERWVDVYSQSGSDLSDEEYYEYPEGFADGHRVEHMRSLVQVSDVDDGVYLLNPEAVTPDGEWEAWLFANWVPGAQRYPSFAHLMLQEYLSFTQQSPVQVSTTDLPRLAVPGPEIPRVPAERVPRKKLPRAAALDQLIAQMKVLEGKPLDKVLRTFFGKLRGRPRADRRPDLVPALVDLFHSSHHAGVRSACVAALEELAEDGLPPFPLLESLSDPDPQVVSSGIHALHYFPDPAALEPLCRFIESRVDVPLNRQAMSALEAMGDERAVPTLTGVLTDTSTPFDLDFAAAASALSRCGSKGFEALVSPLTKPATNSQLPGADHRAS
jgi:hypothetical protein